MHATRPAGAKMNEVPELKRSLFGYRKQDVDTILDARERMFERVTEEAAQRRADSEQLRAELETSRRDTIAAREETQKVRAELNSQLIDLRQELESLRSELARLDDARREAETRATGLETEMRDARREVTALNERLRVADATESDLRTRLEEATSMATPPDTRELGAVLEATQEAIARIMAGARRTAEEDLSRVQHTRDEMQSEIDRVRSWRYRIQPVTKDVAGGIAHAQAQMSQTAERVGEALRPMSEALAAVSDHLDRLAAIEDPTADAERPQRVDLVSHEQEASEARAMSDHIDRGEETPSPAPQEAPAGAPFGPDPWPDPWR